MAFLQAEIAVRQADVGNARTIAQGVTGITSNVQQAIASFNSLAGLLTGYATQLSGLAATVHDQPTAQQALTNANQIWNNARNSEQMLTPARQVWSTAANYEQQRSTWLQSRWTATHTGTPTASAIALRDPLLQSLANYLSVTSRLDADVQAGINSFPPPPVPASNDAGSAVVVWLRRGSAVLSSLASELSQAVTQLTTTLSWANVATAATASVNIAEGQLASAERVVTALGGTPLDPTTLANRISDLVELRLTACPDVVLPADRSLYQARMMELDLAMAGLLATSSGVGSSTPLALLPVRLETRASPSDSGGSVLRVRIYVDDIHVNGHDPRLTDDEVQWSGHLRAAVEGDPTKASAVWAQTAARFGAARAAYLLNPDKSAGSRGGSWSKPATTSALPDVWLVVAYGSDGRPLSAALGKPIAGPLQVGPDPTAHPAPKTAQDLPVDPGLTWMVDFDEAVGKGMAVTLTIDGGAGGWAATSPSAPSGPPPPHPVVPLTLSRVVAVGIKAADGAAILSDLLHAHHCTNSLELVPHGTPTNNTSEAAAGFRSSDPGYRHSYALEIGNPVAWKNNSGVLSRPAPTGDAARLAAALGLDPVVFAAAGPPLMEQSDQQAMTVLTWPATWGTFLTGLTGMSGDRAERLRSWVAAWLRPGGPLPTLRIGTHPYGVLPVLAHNQWSDASDSAANDVHGVIAGLIGPWLDRSVALSGQFDIDELLARSPVSADARVRFTGIMSGWLQPDHDLQGVAYTDIRSTLTALSGRLAQVGSATGLTGSLVWPAESIVLPDPIAPADPWPLVAPDGGLALVAGPGPADAAPASYLTAILTGKPAPGPETLLDALARQSWTVTPGAAASVHAFSQRGNLGDLPEPATPVAADELHGAVTYLSSRTDANFADLLGGALDAAAYRVDAAATALATCRLGQLRSRQKSGLVIGGFGWVENLVARQPLQPVDPPIANETGAMVDRANAGFLHAPSLQQATTAAVLRSGFLTHNPIGTQAMSAQFAIDLSSRRARLAAWILDGVRQGQPLAALLGYRFERALQESNHGNLIDFFRRTAPYDAAIGPIGTPAADPAEAIRAADVVDGVTLLRMYQSASPPAGPNWDLAKGALADLQDASDAVSDAVLAQALHDSLTGGTHAAAATLESVASGAVPPPALQFLSTPRTGVAVHHRVLVPLPVGGGPPPSGWPDSPRGRAEPALNKWVAGLLGDPSLARAAVQFIDSNGSPLPETPTSVTLATLGVGPLDVVALAGQPGELARLAIYKALIGRPPGAPPAAGGMLDDNPKGAARSLASVLAIARAAAQLIGASRGADARDLALSGSSVDPGADLADLATRVNGPRGAYAALQTASNLLAAALPGGPTAPTPGLLDAPSGADPATLASALLSAVAVGVPASAPAGVGPAYAVQLLGQARAAWAKCSRTMKAVQAAEPPAGADALTTLAARLSQLEMAFGGGFRALPNITTNPADLLARAAAATQTGGADPGQEPDAWIVKTSRVHASVADLLNTCCAAEALGTGPALALTVGQLPLPAAGSSRPWVALSFKGTPPAANTLSLTMMAAQPPPAGPLTALLVADWVEVIPSQREVTGITYHYDAPSANAPQSILLGVPARSDATGWSYGDLVSTVGSALDLAHIRGVDYNDLPSLARLVLPAVYISNGPNGALPVSVSSAKLPANYLHQTPANATISSVNAVTLTQGQVGGQIVVTGTNFGLLAPTAFSVDGGGVTVTGGSIPPPPQDTKTTLIVNVDVNAATGQRGVRLGSTNPVTTPVTIIAQPRATYCDTKQLSQGTTVVHKTVIVSGQGLTGATAVITGSDDVTSTAVASDSQIVLIVRIAASSYDPYHDPIGDVAQGPGGKPHAYRSPQHTAVPLTLTVSPVWGPVRTFPITLDAIE